MHARTRRTVAALVAAFSVVASAAPAATAEPAEESTYLVTVKSGKSPREAAQNAGNAGVRVKQVHDHVRSFVISATPGKAAALGRAPGILAVEPEMAVSLAATQTSPPSWGLDRIDQSARPLNSSYTYPNTGSGVDVYVVDTGVRATHVELASKMRSGWTAFTDAYGTSDCQGHGTHVAATIAGTQYGVAKGATIVPVRAMSCAGTGTSTDIVAALNWIVGDHLANKTAVVNMSLGVSSVSTAIDAAIAAVIADGIPVVAAAGNSSVDACNISPAHVADAITVAATDSSDQQATYSNYGTCVDLYGPGTGIVSADYQSDTGTTTKSGTSMAAPHVSGVAAMILAANPAFTPADVAGTLITSAVSGVVTGTSAGTPNRFLQASGSWTAGGGSAGSGAIETGEQGPTSTLTGTVTNVAWTPAIYKGTLTWTKPAYPLAHPTTHLYVKTYKAGTLVKTTKVGATTTKLAVSTMSLSTDYTFEITAYNANGAGPTLTYGPVQCSLPTVPAPVTTLVAAASAIAPAVKLTWKNGVNGGAAFTKKTVVAYRNGTPELSIDLAGSATSVTLSTLEPGVTYTFGVTAYNVMGPSEETVSAAFTTLVPSVPGPVTGLTATILNAPAVNLTWQLGTSGNVPRVAQYLTVTSGGQPVTTVKLGGTTTKYTVKGLPTNTTYQFAIYAVNMLGSSTTVSTGSVYVPTPTAPGAPTVTLSSPIPGQLAATWTITNSGNLVLTKQNVRIYRDGVLVATKPVAVGTQTLAFTGLYLGSTYRVSVELVNALGSSGEATSNTYTV